MKQLHYEFHNINKEDVSGIMDEKCGLTGFKTLVKSCSEPRLGVVTISVLDLAYQDLHRQIGKIFHKYPYIDSLPKHVYNVHKIFNACNYLIAVINGLQLQMGTSSEEEIFKRISLSLCLEGDCEHKSDDICASMALFRVSVACRNDAAMVLELLRKAHAILQFESQRFQRSPQWLSKAIYMVMAAGWGIKVHVGLATSEEVDNIQGQHKCDGDCMRKYIGPEVLA